jgi:hypothetical protein
LLIYGIQLGIKLKIPASIRQSIKDVAISVLLPSTSANVLISDSRCSGVTPRMLFSRNSQSSGIEPTVVGIINGGVVS